jgi:predicted TIM-barrel fold metal-dependent hydrolase
MHIRSEGATAVWGALCDAMPAACGEDFAGPPPPTDADDVIAVLDEAGLEKGVLLSLGYFYGFPELAGSEFDDRERVRAENRYIAEQVAQYPARLAGFFSVSPTADYALDEIRYWVAEGGLLGLKLQLANSAFDFTKPEQLERLGAILSLLSEHELPLVVHLRNRDPDYGVDSANAFIDLAAARAPNIVVHVAHLAGWGAYDPGTDAALGAFLTAIAEGRLSRDNVWFDIGAVVMPNLPDEALARVTARLRQIGFDRVLFATDWDAAEAPAQHLSTLQSRLDLSGEEWEMLVTNQAPYLRRP